MTIRVGVWLMLGLGLGLFQVVLITISVAQLTPHATARVRQRVVLWSVMRFALSLVAMTVAIHSSIMACVFVGLGELVGRWSMVLFGASHRLMRPRPM